MSPRSNNQPVGLGELVRLIPTLAVMVITNPVSFFREMPRKGGFFEPIVFVAAMGVIAGIVAALLSLFGLGAYHSFAMALASIVYTPIIAVVMGFIIGAILFIIWKVMGSQESYETAFRCAAYASAISPITTILNIIPFIGGVIGLLWGTYLMVIASSEVHNIRRKTAWIVFGIIFGILAIITITSQFAARKMKRIAEEYREEMEQQDMTQEEMKKAAEEFMKKMQKEIDR